MGFIDPEAAIAERLQARIDAVDWTGKSKPRVLSAADAANMEERSQIVPAFYIVFDSYAPTQQVGQGMVQEIAQDWTINVAVRNARSHANAQGVRDEAAPLIDIVIRALAGWKPAQDFSAFRLIAGTGPAFTEAGFGYFPLTFQTRTTVRGVQ